MRYMILAVLLAACGPELNTTVECTGVRPMTCDCAVSCVTTTEQVLVTTDEPRSCEPLCYVRR